MKTQKQTNSLTGRAMEASVTYRLGGMRSRFLICLRNFTTPVSKLKGPVTDCVLPGKPFIWLPFAGGISAFAVILPKPI